MTCRNRTCKRKSYKKQTRRYKKRATRQYRRPVRRTYRHYDDDYNYDYNYGYNYGGYRRPYHLTKRAMYHNLFNNYHTRTKSKSAVGTQNGDHKRLGDEKIIYPRVKPWKEFATNHTADSGAYDRL